MNKLVISNIIIFVLIVWGCNDKGNPVSTEQLPPFLFGKIVDNQGNSIDSVDFHYIFNLDDAAIYKTNKTCPSTVISYSIPKRSYVSITIYRWFTRDSITTLVNDTLDAGMHSTVFNASKVTNGIYIYRLVIDTVIQEKKMCLIDLDISTLVQTIPLTVSNSSGEFSLPYGIFGFGIPFTRSSTGNSDSISTTYVSRTITIVLYKSGYATLVQSITIDTTNGMRQQFQLER